MIAERYRQWLQAIRIAVAHNQLEPAAVLAAVADAIIGRWPDGAPRPTRADLAQLRLFAAAAEVQKSADEMPTVAALGLPAIPGNGTHTGEPLPVDLLGWVREALLHPHTRRETGAHYTPTTVARRLAEITLADGEAVGAGTGTAGGVAAGDVSALGGSRWSDANRTNLPDVCDPAVGGGAFLLAAARALEDKGHARATIVSQSLWGSDVDELAVAVTEATLVLWAWEAAAGAPVAPAAPSVSDLPSLTNTLVVADALLAGRAAWPTRDGRGFAAVIGNPPFVGQLAEATARTSDQAQALRARYGDAVQGYTDTAAIFLLAALELCQAGGHVGFLQPESFLAVRDGAGCRRGVLERAELTGIWLAREQVFSAAISVCAPVLRVGRMPLADGRIAIRRWTGAELDEQPEIKVDSGELRAAPTWAHLVADLRGVPSSPIRSSGRLGDRCRATAGFRDEYYGLVPVVGELSDIPAGPTYPLVTCGVVDPGLCLWGRRPVRFAGKRFAAPVVDVERLRREAAETAEANAAAAATAAAAALTDADAATSLEASGDGRAPKRPRKKAARIATPPAERLLRWVDAQLVPKVVVATQTRVIEAAVDGEGTWVPSVPVVAVVPEPGELWHIAAALLAPSTTAWALERYGGTALVSDAVKLSARQVLDVPLPVDQAAWDEGAVLLQQVAAAEDEDDWRTLLVRFGAAMARSYDLDADDPVVEWWAGRLPSWSKPDVARDAPTPRNQEGEHHGAGEFEGAEAPVSPIDPTDRPFGDH